MSPNKSCDQCPLCGGEKLPGTTTFTADLGSGVVVVRSVPATICNQCGADWIEDHVAKQLESIVDDARKKGLQVEVTSLVDEFMRLDVTVSCRVPGACG
jgi:YgiT-type zinc finger domain-containing protein